MAFMSTINIIGSGLTAEQTRLDVISENITNQGTTRTEGGGAYRRKTITFEAVSNKDGFRLAMSRAAQRSHTVSNRDVENAGGVRVTEIGEDDTELPFVYDPGHPDANAEGYVEIPNVTLVKEMADAMAASQAYNADVSAFNILKQVVAKGLEIGR